MSTVVRKGFFQRIFNSFIGAIIGLVLFLGSFVLLSWNEYDAIRQTGAITEIDKVAIADIGSEEIDPGNQGKLIHVATTAETDEELEYREFGIRERAMRLRWDSSIYQWKESKRERDDRTVYEYDKKWVDKPINSSSFRESGSHSNEGSQLHFQDGHAEAKEIRFGAFRLSKKLIGQIKGEQQFSLSESHTMDVRPAGRVSDGIFYTGDPSSPSIGDEKVEVFIVAPEQQATVMAQQKGNTFEAYQTKVGVPKEILYMGLLSKEEVIVNQRSEAALKRWMLRGGGFLAMWFGMSMIFSPLKAIVSFIPFAGRLMDGAIGFVTFLIAIALTAVTISIAWIAVRPILSIGLLVAAAAALYFAYQTKSKSGADVGSAVPPPVPPPLPS